MTRQYHYDCPLRAAYMAKEFGVNLGIDEVRDPETNNLVDYTLEIIDSDLHWKDCTKFTIHPDSLHIFEPRVGDLCKINVNDDIASEVSHDFCLWRDSEGGGCYSFPLKIHNKDGKLEFRDFVYRDLIIVQRNNKPFFMPERG